MDNMITLTIDGIEVQAPQGSTVLEAAKLAGIRIPTLCFLKDINEIGALWKIHRLQQNVY